MQKEKNQRFFRPSILPKSRKGDVTVLILVLGVVALCGLAIISFYSSAVKGKEVIVGYEFVEELNSEIDEYYLYKDLGVDDKVIIDLLDLEKDSRWLYINVSDDIKGRSISVVYYLP